MALFVSVAGEQHRSRDGDGADEEEDERAAVTHQFMYAVPV